MRRATTNLPVGTPVLLHTTSAGEPLPPMRGTVIESTPEHMAVQWNGGGVGTFEPFMFDALTLDA